MYVRAGDGVGHADGGDSGDGHGFSGRETGCSGCRGLASSYSGGGSGGDAGVAGAGGGATCGSSEEDACPDIRRCLVRVWRVTCTCMLRCIL